MELRILETPHKNAGGAFAILRIDDDHEGTFAWADSREEAVKIVSEATAYAVWEFENDWYVRIPGLLPVCMNTREAAEFMIELHKNR